MAKKKQIIDCEMGFILLHAVCDTRHAFTHSDAQPFSYQTQTFASTICSFCFKMLTLLFPFCNHITFRESPNYSHATPESLLISNCYSCFLLPVPLNLMAGFLCIHIYLI